MTEGYTGSGHACRQVGFTLIEMSIVAFVIAVVAAGTISMGNSMLESVRKVNTTNKLDEIEAALMSFQLAYHYSAILT
jgi:prepilin-type N-terminal cleavage/methylation domain-containing protein